MLFVACNVVNTVPDDGMNLEKLTMMKMKMRMKKKTLVKTLVNQVLNFILAFWESDSGVKFSNRG